jgi:hypothetical protein
MKTRTRADLKTVLGSTRRSRSEQAALFLSVLLLGACARAPSHSGQREIAVVPELDVNNPASIPAWEASQFNVWRSKIEVSRTKHFHDALGTGQRPAERQVPVEMCGAREKGIVREQRAALARLLANEEVMYGVVRKAIYRNYVAQYPELKKVWAIGSALFGGGADASDVLPEIVKGDELDRLVTFSRIRVFPPKEGLSKIGIECHCPWDEEHDIGVLLSGDNVEDVSTAHIACPH